MTTVAEVGAQAVKLKAEDQRGTLCLTGYVVRSDGTNGNPAEKGQANAMSALYLSPLPRLDVKIENGQISVRMPAS